jgi:peptidoglycan/LPS O-acetylase OafA/YrhL
LKDTLPAVSGTFRQDINGLRAIAVSAVVLYHYHIAPFWSGYVGVDVFFVISGYLMTQIITSGIDGDRFSMAQFFWARCSRIVPALFVVVAAVLMFGWFYVEPFEYQKLAFGASSSLLFYSNMLYYSRGGGISQALPTVTGCFTRGPYR